jgi:SAM-dependent methyltransferase
VTLQDEKSFFDETIAHDGRDALAPFYRVTQRRERGYADFLRAHGAGRRVLEYGCGTGAYAFDLAACGARVVGIDISPVSIRAAERRARAERLETVHFLEMNAERMAFRDGEFDLVCGSGILHHLDLETALGELCRVLRPDGTAIFMEPLGHNPVFNLFRRATPQYRTPDEHPLRRAHFALLRRRFRSTEVVYHHLFSLLAVPLGRTKLFGPALRALDALDRVALRVVPGLKWWAWYSVIILRGPRAAPPPDGADRRYRSAGS